MEDLPKDHVNITRPFLKQGADIAGPLQMKNSPQSCAFRINSSLATDDFLVSFSFIAMRGNPKVIYSDNGTIWNMEFIPWGGI